MPSRRTASSRARAATSRSPRPSPRARPSRDGYWGISARPLHILAFLLPLVVLYEFGSAVYLITDTAGTHRTIQAQRLLGQFFELFGVVGLFLPGIALLTVLVVWHVLLGDRWKLDLRVIGGMAVEAAGWTLPLLVLAAVHSRATSPGAPAAVLAVGSGGDLLGMPWQARLTISIGAGLYEEMLFRLLLIAFLHLVLADLALIRKNLAYPLCVVGSALAFAMYHDVTLAGGAGTDWAKFLFFLASGIYLGTVYVLRGFGIVVGTHAMYDALVLVLLRSP